MTSDAWLTAARIAVAIWITFAPVALVFLLHRGMKLTIRVLDGHEKRLKHVEEFLAADKPEGKADE